jgi:hypothetical protein
MSLHCVCSGATKTTVVVVDNAGAVRATVEGAGTNQWVRGAALAWMCHVEAS